MNSPRIVTTYVPITRKKSDFDSCPDVSALMHEENGRVYLSRFACSVPLTQWELVDATDRLFDEYRNSVSSETAAFVTVFANAFDAYVDSLGFAPKDCQTVVHGATVGLRDSRGNWREPIGL